MLSGSEFRAIVSGRRRGVRAALWRAVLAAAEGPYALAVWWRNRRFDRRAELAHRVSVPVVSVGNLTLGGTGKTPMVEWIARWFRERGVRVTLVSRGYGAEAGACNDEAIELEQKLPDVPHVQNPDRVAAAEMAIEEFECELILLDDAFQHRRIARDLDIVLLDALEPFGFDHLFPRGTLREGVAGLKRAGVVVLSRADMLSAAERDAVHERVRRYAPDARWVEAVHAPRALWLAGGKQRPVETLRGAAVAAFCGIGNPQGFRHTLESCGCRIAAFREFPDHHPYARSDVESLARWADALDVAAVVCTHKDLVKLDVERLGSRELVALSIGLQVREGREELESALAVVLDNAARQAGACPRQGTGAVPDCDDRAG